MPAALFGGEPAGVFALQECLDNNFQDQLVAQVKPLDDPAALKAFRQFNARTELFGFMLHYDCRAGMADTGPYPLPDGTFAIVRDHFEELGTHKYGRIAHALGLTQEDVIAVAHYIREKLNPFPARLRRIPGASSDT